MTSLNRPNPASSSHSNWDAAAKMSLWDSLQELPARAQSTAVTAPWLGEGKTFGAVQAAALTGYALFFGDRIPCHDWCPECDTHLGVELSVQALIATQQAAPEVSGELSCGDWIIEYHLPMHQDLTRFTAVDAVEDLRLNLLRVTVDRVTENFEARTLEEIPAEIMQALAARIEEEDPLAAAEMALGCPDCGVHWESGFDACAVFLARLEAWARRTLLEVHQLAMRYGWSEAELLAMRPVRREAYLLMDAP